MVLEPTTTNDECIAAKHDTIADENHDEPEDPSHQCQPTPIEQIHWALVGIGCTWFLGDSTNLEIPWWVHSQVDGLNLGDRIALAGTLALLAAPLCLVLRTFFRDMFYRVIVIIAITLSLVAGGLLALGLWRISSNFIFASVLLSQIVGQTIPYGVVPYMMCRHYKPALISSLYLGGSISSMLASLLSMLQSPGHSHMFTPTIFFQILIAPVLLSFAAYFRVVSRGIGKLPDEQQGSDLEETLNNSLIHRVPAASNSRMSLTTYLPQRGTLRVWCAALPLALMSGSMALGSFTVLRSALPFAATNTVQGHSICYPSCSNWCADLGPDRCSVYAACRQTSSGCAENRGEEWIAWGTSMAQFAFASGIGATILFPSNRLYICLLVWTSPFAFIVILAKIGDGTFEHSWSGPLLVACMVLARAAQGYFEVMQWRYIACVFKENKESVTIFVSTINSVVGFFGGLLVAYVIDAAGFFVD